MRAQVLRPFAEGRLRRSRLASVPCEWKFVAHNFSLQPCHNFFVRPNVFDRGRSRATAISFRSPKSPPPATRVISNAITNVGTRGSTTRDDRPRPLWGNGRPCKNSRRFRKSARRRLMKSSRRPFFVSGTFRDTRRKSRRSNHSRRVHDDKIFVSGFFRYVHALTRIPAFPERASLSKIFQAKRLEQRHRAGRRIFAASNIFSACGCLPPCSAPLKSACS